MFHKHTYITRRKALKQELGNGLIILLGNEESGINYADNWYPFRQDSTFLYYCGLDKAHLALIIDIDNNREILFGVDPKIDDIIWTGPVCSLEELAEKTGIDEHRPYEDINSYLDKISAQKPIHFLPPYRPEHSRKLRNWLRIDNKNVHDSSSQRLIKAVVKQRSIKSPKEIAQIEEAVTITAGMHLAAMRSTHLGMKEYEVMSRVHQKALEMDGQLSFPIILTTNGHILHNHYYGNTIEKGMLVLCDAGAENKMHYAGDLSRTFPAGKKFTNLQGDIYEVVLEAQRASANALKPGVLFREIHLIACIKLVEGLISLGFMKGDPEEAIAAGAHTLFFQCGLGHMMGLDVHDMENLGEENVGYTSDLKRSTEFGLKSLRLARALEPGFVVTVEPGIYIIPELIELRNSEGKYKDFVCYEKLQKLDNFGGIRIEDDYVVTEKGCRALGAPLPKKREAIEAIRAETLS